MSENTIGKISQDIDYYGLAEGSYGLLKNQATAGQGDGQPLNTEAQLMGPEISLEFGGLVDRDWFGVRPYVSLDHLFSIKGANKSGPQTSGSSTDIQVGVDVVETSLPATYHGLGIAAGYSISKFSSSDDSKSYQHGSPSLGVRMLAGFELPAEFFTEIRIEGTQGLSRTVSQGELTAGISIGKHF